MAYLESSVLTIDPSEAQILRLSLARVGFVMSESDSDHYRAAELRAQIAAHNEAYHGRDQPSVPDSTYDKLLR